MAAIDTEAIWEALRERLEENTTSFQRVTRRRKLWTPEECPVLMVLDDEGDEDLLSDPDAPGPVFRLSGDLIIQAKGQPADTDEKPTAALNALVKEVREALERKDTDPLGSGSFSGRGHLQHYTNLAGRLRTFAITKVEKGAGELTGTSIARISIQMDTAAL